jgi:hypothetical protein
MMTINELKALGEKIKAVNTHLDEINKNLPDKFKIKSINPVEPTNETTESLVDFAEKSYDNAVKKLTPRILCAAIYFDDGLIYVHQPKNIMTGFVICGRRHHNCYSILGILSSDKKHFNFEKTQGFITSDDLFVNRKEAADIAFAAGQINELKDELYSEDLY